MTKANILPENNLYKWFEMTIYYFHVPLFFICSGYLYQKYSRVTSVDCWCKNILKKALALGVPYMTFSTATWVLKLNINNALIHVVIGLSISFSDPIVANMFMEKTKWLEFFLYPNKVLNSISKQK